MMMSVQKRLNPNIDIICDFLVHVEELTGFAVCPKNGLLLILTIGLARTICDIV
jgi:hypothetical protein